MNGASRRRSTATDQFFGGIENLRGRLWWRWWESNPRPRNAYQEHLRVYPSILSLATVLWKKANLARQPALLYIRMRHKAAASIDPL